MGQNTPPPIEEDIPEEMIHSDSIITGRITKQLKNQVLLVHLRLPLVNKNTRLHKC